MSAFVVFGFDQPALGGREVLEQLQSIFFESSTKKDFINQKDRDLFCWKYLGFYLAHYPEYALVAMEKEKVLGYLVGMPFSQDPSLFALQPHMGQFQDQFLKFPAHLHINCHESSRGQGVGQNLMNHFLNKLKNEGVRGVHILTGHESRNRDFYRKLGFLHEFNLGTICFMGKDLSC